MNPAPPDGATTAAAFIALGGGATITDCGLPVTVSFVDDPSVVNICSTTSITRTYTVTIDASTNTDVTEWTFTYDIFKRV